MPAVWLLGSRPQFSKLCDVSLLFLLPLGPTGLSHVRSFQCSWHGFSALSFSLLQIFPTWCISLLGGKLGNAKTSLAKCERVVFKRTFTPKQPYLQGRWVGKSPQEKAEVLWNQDGRCFLYILQLKPPGYLLLEGSHGVDDLSRCFIITRAGFLICIHLGCISEGIPCKLVMKRLRP